jgi:hypothetical protein
MFALTEIRVLGNRCWGRVVVIFSTLEFKSDMIDFFLLFLGLLSVGPYLFWCFGKISASLFWVTELMVIYLSLIQSPWRCRQHDCPKCQNSVMTLRGLTTQKSLFNNTRRKSLKYFNVFLIFILKHRLKPCVGNRPNTRGCVERSRLMWL